MDPIKLFISYSDMDKNKLKSLEKIIKKNPPLVAIIIANDRQPSKHLTEKVITGIKESHYFIPIMTKNSIHAQWLNQEIGYAVSQGKTIIPIVNKKIMNKLRGFIHKQLDLPYQFEGKANNKLSEATKFYEEGKKVISDILIENKIVPISFFPESYFPGSWNCMFSGPITGNEIFEVRDKNKYYVNNEHWFDIEKFAVDSKKRKISFIKAGLPQRNDPRKLYNDLNIIEIGIRYEGNEGNEKMVYQKV